MASSKRNSYRGLMQKPAWLLLDEDKKIVASIRADTIDVARELFKAHNLTGRYLRRG